MPRTTRPLVIFAAFAGSLAVGLFLMLWAVGGLRTVAAPAAIGGPFQLTDQSGQTVTDKNLQGKPTLIFFGFTHCPDICPTTLQVLATARQTLADNGRGSLPRIVLVSVDPERDTPEILGRYVDYFGAGNLGLTGTLEEIRKLTGGLGIYFEKQPGSDDGYGVDHSGAVLLIDPDGGFHSLFGGPHVVEDYVHDLPLLMGGR